MIDFEDAVATAYELSCLFEMAQTQAETGRLRLIPTNYSYQSDLNRVINRVAQEQFGGISNQTTTQEKFLNYLLSDTHSFQVRKTSLRLAVATFEKQSQVFMLASTNQSFSKSPLYTDTNSPEKIIHLATKHAVVLATQLQEAESTLAQEEPLFGKEHQTPKKTSIQAIQQMKEKIEQEKFLAQQRENEMLVNKKEWSLEQQREAMIKVLAMQKSPKP